MGQKRQSMILFFRDDVEGTREKILHTEDVARLACNKVERLSGRGSMNHAGEGGDRGGWEVTVGGRGGEEGGGIIA